MVAVCFPANEKIGPGDRFIVNELAKVRRTTKVAVATKTDLATPEQIGEHLLDIQRLGEETRTEWAEIVPVSAVGGDQVALLADLLVGLLPEGPQLYPDGDLTDAPEEIDRRRADPRGRARRACATSCRTRSRWWSRRWRCARTVRRTSRCSTSTPTSTSSATRRRAS